MTYTVAAICGTDINFVDDVFGAPPGENYLYEGYKGNGDLLLWGNSTSNIKKTPYSFDVSGTKYYTKSTLSPEDGWSLPFSNVISCQAAIANGRVLTVSTAVNLSMLDLHVQPMYATLLANYPSYYRCIDSNSVTSYTTKGIPLQLAKFGDDDYSSAAFRVCLCLFATSSEFYALEFESIRLTSGILGRLVLKKSTDGVNWTTFLESLQNGFPFYTSYVSAERNFALGSYVGAKCPKSNRVFIGHTGTFFKNPPRLTTSLNLGVTWEGVDIGRFDGLNWYSDNGVMYLCAVRISDAGCFGTKICDESGNMFPIVWRESATNWNPTKTRLDAGYMGDDPNNY